MEKCSHDNTGGSLPAEHTELLQLPWSPAVVGLQPASAQYSESDLQTDYNSEKQEDKNCAKAITTNSPCYFEE